MHVDGGQADRHRVGAAFALGPTHSLVRSRRRMHARTAAARRRGRRRARRGAASTAFWLSDPLSVISRGVDATAARRAGPRAPRTSSCRCSRRRARRARAEIAAHARVREHRRAGAVRSEIGAEAAAQRAGSGRPAPTTKSRSWPAITTSCTSRAPCARIRARSGPTLTHVPVESLKSSASRPSKISPLPDRSGSTNRIASPSR